MAEKSARKSNGKEQVSDWVYTYPADFVDHLEATIKIAEQNLSVGSLLIVELENLAMLVGAHGHVRCEEIISSFITQVANLVDGDGSAVFRIQRNQFGIVCQSCGKEEATLLADKINNLAHNFGSSTSLVVHLLTRIGAVDFPTGAKSPLEAINNALIALFDRNALNFSNYARQENSNQSSMQQMEIAQYLNRAIQKKKLRLGFQPVITAKTGSIQHYEALLRVIGDDGKISSAGALVPVAEKMGMIHVIDHLVLDMVMKELKEAPNITLAFNISNLTTSDEKWLAYFTEMMNRNPDVASRMIVEVTETAAHRDLRETAYFIATIQGLGCRVSLDDFGSGYTSFRQLKALSVDIVKIDGSFIKDLVDNSDNRFFVKTLLDFTNALGLETVAECVESGEVAKLLMELGVTHMQGFYFSKPHLQRAWLTEGEFSKEI